MDSTIARIVQARDLNHMGLQGLLDIVYNQGNVHSPVLLPESGGPEDLAEPQEGGTERPADAFLK